MTGRTLTRPPELHVIAGSNGSGKSTLYERELRHRLLGLPFINADDLARDAFGHAAVTREQAQEGQRLANDARDRLLAAGEGFLTETTFSHKSKIELIERARALGYVVTIYQVGLRSADLAVERVGQRVAKGGHPVPEEKTRARWERSQPLIRDAVRMADVGYVYDNSQDDQPHRIALILRRGVLTHVAMGQVPQWVRRLYPEELSGYEPAALNPSAHSFQQARVLTAATLGDGARLYVANRGGSYVGEILARTSLHTVQQLRSDNAVAHFTAKLEPAPAPGSYVRIAYSGQPPRGTVTALARPGQKATRPPNPAAAAAFRDLPPDQAAKAHPELKDAYALVRAFAAYLDLSGCPSTPALTSAFRARVARAIEEGQALPAVGVASDATRPDRGQGRAR